MEIICDHNSCTSCQVCKFVCPTNAISMQEDEHGFVYPVINASKCINCHKCRKICPALNLRKDFRLPMKTYAGWTKDKVNRHYSTSGGFAYELSKATIAKGGVVCGCRWRIDHAEHAIAETMEEIRQFQGSKYAYSDINDCYSRIKEYLKQDRKVMFFGTGCQVAGLKAFLHAEYENLVIVDILCHGIPSQKGLQDRIRFVEQENKKKVVDMRFRDKKEDVFHTYCKYTFEDGSSSYCTIYQDFFFRGFVTNHLLRPNCFSCRYAQEKRISDITLADFWGYTPGKFSFLKYEPGVSLALTNTEKGIATIEALENVKIEERPFEMAKRGNRNLNAPQMRPITYDVFWQRYLGGEPICELSKQYFPPSPESIPKKMDLRLFVNLIIGSKNMSVLGLFIRKHFRWIYGPFVDWKRKHKKNVYEMKEYERFVGIKPGGPRVFYFGITSHVNLGDLAQHYCIKKWISDNYPDRELVMLESDVIVNPRITSRFFAHMKNIFKDEDVIVFQSGYCTQDLGGNHPLMHRLVCEYMPNAHILMMPQTIYFRHKENKNICAENHNKAKNMLFLARDFKSYDMAKEMFPDIKVKAFPDIVTTLIGTLQYSHPRNGICLCTRNDGEKLYTAEQINELAFRFEDEGIHVKQKDTQSGMSLQVLRANLRGYIEAEIESYSYYKVTITDRYHGTIFSLCAGTPVVIIKTKDHKVITGADWFKGVYDDYIYVANNLDDAYQIAIQVIRKKISHQLRPYFQTNYYDNLKHIFESKEQ